MLINKFFDYEICHYFEEKKLKVFSKRNQIFFTYGKKTKSIKLPILFWKNFFIYSRIFRRLFRLDKMNVTLVKKNVFLILYQSKAYLYNIKSNHLQLKFNLKNCRNVLHNSICVTNNGYIFIGEYGSNKKYKNVPIHVSYDYGLTWQVKYIFKKKEIRHIHGIFYDKFENNIWICTGDTNKESKILKLDFFFNNKVLIGENSQNFRTCKIFFTKKFVYWSMDSHLVDSSAVIYNRNKKTIEKSFSFPGPIIYSKFFIDGNYIVSTSQENGPSVKDDKVHLYMTKDFRKWKKIYDFEHDGMNKTLFKFGLICFSEGNQKTSNFIIFCEAIKKYDGKVICCSIKD